MICHVCFKSGVHMYDVSPKVHVHDTCFREYLTEHEFELWRTFDGETFWASFENGNIAKVWKQADEFVCCEDPQYLYCVWNNHHGFLANGSCATLPSAIGCARDCATIGDGAIPQAIHVGDTEKITQ